MPASFTHLQQLESEGFTVLEGIADPVLIHRIRTELAPWLQGRLLGRNDFEGTRTERVYALLAKAPSIAELVEHPTVLSLLDALLPKNYLLSGTTSVPSRCCWGILTSARR